MKKSKIFMIVSIIILVVAVIVSLSTYAYYVWSTSDAEETKIVTSIGAATVYFDGGSAISDSKLRPVSDKSKGISKEIQIKAEKTGLTFDLYLDLTTLDNNLKHESFKFELYKGSTLVKEGNFSNDYLTSNLVTCSKNSTNHIVLLDNESLSTSVTSYYLYIWIDGANYTNPNTMQNKTFSFNLHASGEDAVIKEGKIPDINITVTNSLAYDIVSSYIASDKTDVTNNGILYHYDDNNKLMSDTAGNVRYYGADPNNYIYFNCTTYPNTGCETWRIIGVFEGKLKLIRGINSNTSNKAPIGDLAWDQNKNIDSSVTTYTNQWSDINLDNTSINNSSLQLLLNNEYYYGDTFGTVTYLTGSSGGTSKSLNMASIGIKNDTTRSLISESTWYLRCGSSSIYPDKAYDIERVSGTVRSGCPASWTGKIALAYPSDYGYAADLSQCTGKTLDYYNDSTCASNNYMNGLFTSRTNFMLTTNSSGSNYALSVSSSGQVSQNGSVYSAYGVVPVLHLNSDVSIVSGDGSSGLPYQISVS